jgi:hypothetical protein
MDKIKMEVLPSAAGLLHCLRALAQEAATLNLHHTLSAIEDAMETAVRECCEDAARAQRAILH